MHDTTGCHNRTAIHGCCILLTLLNLLVVRSLPPCQNMIFGYVPECHFRRVQRVHCTLSTCLARSAFVLFTTRRASHFQPYPACISMLDVQIPHYVFHQFVCTDGHTEFLGDLILMSVTLRPRMQDVLCGGNCMMACYL